jgi:(5-formylfuran-3-yl)methyl phosphate synthase
MMRGSAPRFLASVRDVGEALLAARLGADIIDLKEPRQGALGAVPEREQRAILAALGRGRPLVSATVGDLPFEPEVLVSAINRTTEVGVDLVKFGVFAAGEAAMVGLVELDRQLRRTPPARPLVVLFLADRLAAGDEAAVLARAALRVCGVAGVMLDTADKGSGRLVEVMAPAELSRFVAAVHAGGGFAGLAGSLSIGDIDALASTGADVLGFRGALCHGDRKASLCVEAFARVRDQIDSARVSRRAAASAA